MVKNGLSYAGADISNRSPESHARSFLLIQERLYVLWEASSRFLPNFMCSCVCGRERVRVCGWSRNSFLEQALGFLVLDGFLLYALQEKGMSAKSVILVAGCTS